MGGIYFEHSGDKFIAQKRRGMAIAISAYGAALELGKKA